MSSTLNLETLRNILLAIQEEAPIPNHKLANALNVHPATIKNTVNKAKKLLGVELEISRLGYTGIKSGGALDLDSFLGSSVNVEG